MPLQLLLPLGRRRSHRLRPQIQHPCSHNIINTHAPRALIGCQEERYMVRELTDALTSSAVHITHTHATGASLSPPSPAGAIRARAARRASTTGRGRRCRLWLQRRRPQPGWGPRSRWPGAAAADAGCGPLQRHQRCVPVGALGAFRALAIGIEELALRSCTVGEEVLRQLVNAARGRRCGGRRCEVVPLST